MEKHVPLRSACEAFQVASVVLWDVSGMAAGPFGCRVKSRLAVCAAAGAHPSSTISPAESTRRDQASPMEQRPALVPHMEPTPRVVIFTGVRRALNPAQAADRHDVGARQHERHGLLRR